MVWLFFFQIWISGTLNSKSSVTVNCRSNWPLIVFISFWISRVSFKTLSILAFCLRILPIISKMRDVYEFLQTKTQIISYFKRSKFKIQYEKNAMFRTCLNFGYFSRIHRLVWRVMWLSASICRLILRLPLSLIWFRQEVAWCATAIKMFLHQLDFDISKN